MAQPEKSEIQGGVVFDLNAAVNDAIGACGGDLLATVRSLVVADNFLLAQHQALGAELTMRAADIARLHVVANKRRTKTGDPHWLTISLTCAAATPPICAGRTSGSCTTSRCKSAGLEFPAEL